MWALANPDRLPEGGLRAAMRTPLAGELTESSRPWT